MSDGAAITAVVVATLIPVMGMLLSFQGRLSMIESKMDMHHEAFKKLNKTILEKL